MLPQSARIPATVMHGDGIGPEIIATTLRVLAALGAPFDWDEQSAGLVARNRTVKSLTLKR